MFISRDRRIATCKINLTLTCIRRKNVVFWGAAPCRYCVNQNFGGTYHLHLHGRKIHERGTCMSRWLQTESPIYIYIYICVCVCVCVCVCEILIVSEDVVKIWKCRELDYRLSNIWLRKFCDQIWQDGTVKEHALYVYHIVFNAQWNEQRKMVTLQDNNNIIHLYFLWEIFLPHCKHRSCVFFLV
jgi:hypothetical protein